MFLSFAERIVNKRDKGGHLEIDSWMDLIDSRTDCQTGPERLTALGDVRTAKCRFRS
jgi:hypothetical protein